MTMRKLRPDMTRKEAVRAYRQIAADLAAAEQTIAELRQTLARVGAVRTDPDIAAKLAAIANRLYDTYLERGYHTFRYWRDRDEGEAALAALLGDFVEELYPAEWAAAWEPFANDATVLSRDPRAAEGQP